MIERDGPVESDRELFDKTITAFEAVKARLELPDGCHNFDIANPKYTSVSVTDWSHSGGSVYVQMTRVQQSSHRTPTGEMYEFVRSELVDLRNPNHVQHSFSDYMLFPKKRDAHDRLYGGFEELQDFDVTYALSAGENFSPELRDLMRDIQAVLPTLSLDQYDMTSSEWADGDWHPTD